MAKKSPSSPKPHSKKAVTPSLSTTSSTIAKTSRGELSEKELDEAGRIGEPSQDSKPDWSSQATYLRRKDATENLSEDLQLAYLSLIARGAPPASACSALRIQLADVIWTIEHDEQFESMLKRAQDLLSQNVAAALYKSAIEGSVSAQQSYLKNRPPPDWLTSQIDSTSPQAEMTDDELLEHFRTQAVALLSELDGRSTENSEPQ